MYVYTYTADTCTLQHISKFQHWMYIFGPQSDIVDLTKEALAEENRRLLSDMSVMKARHDEALSCVRQKDKEIEDVLMDYTALQKNFDDLQQQFKCKLNEMEQESKRIHKKKEEHRMEYKQVQREKEEAKHEYKLLQKEMEHLRHECKQIQEHHMTVHAAETLELKKEVSTRMSILHCIILDTPIYYFYYFWK